MFNNFVGNKNVKEIIGGMLNGGHIPHAILLEGEQGLGKRTLSRELAKSILCMNGAEACCECRSCKLFDAGSNPDFSVISPVKNIISVDEIRTLRRRAYDRPDRCESKVYIIEDAEKMNVSAANAFLKILEEPPQYVVFILLSCSASMLLETIISRCTVLTLNAPTFIEAKAVLKSTCQDATDEQIESALSLTDNNIGRAIAQLQNEKSGDDAKTVELVMTALGGHHSYEVLKILSRYNRDSAGFSSFLKLLYSRASIELRRISMGYKPTVTLSRTELINITDEATKTLTALRPGCLTELVITHFCAAITK